jgi:hypothetical protein
MWFTQEKTTLIVKLPLLVSGLTVEYFYFVEQSQAVAYSTQQDNIERCCFYSVIRQVAQVSTRMGSDGTK